MTQSPLNFQLRGTENPGMLHDWLSTTLSRHGHPTPDSRERVYPGAINRPQTVPLQIGNLSCRATFYPERRAVQELARQEGATSPLLAEFSGFGAKLRLIGRHVPYAAGHSLLIDPGVPQAVDEARLCLGLAVARALGPDWTFWLSIGGMTHNSFHIQMCRETMPVTTAILSQKATLCEKTNGADGAVRTGHLRGWLTNINWIESEPPAVLANAVVGECSAFCALGLTYDVTWRFDGRRVLVLVFKRRMASIEALRTAPEDIRRLGSIGALELGGWLLSVNDDADTFQGLAADLRTFASLYRRALFHVALAESEEALT